MGSKTKVGTVVSDKMDKSITVRVEFHKAHPMYDKVIARHSKIKAHDEDNQCRIGDRVRIRETRPISKSKSWIVDEIVESGAKPGLAESQRLQEMTESVEFDEVPESGAEETEVGPESEDDTETGAAGEDEANEDAETVGAEETE